MPDLDLKISGPESIIFEHASRLLVAFIENDTKRRETMSEAARAEQDKIMAQIYWDWRKILQSIGIVGEPK